ncbi:MAG: dusB [Ignavibacteria bacterium]|nr:dusB [Ignavibacteria bacterium]
MKNYINKSAEQGFKIGRQSFSRGIFLAPMEGVTDQAFRLICRNMGADLAYTEFIASEALVRNVEKSKSKMLFYEEERPVAIQIFGGNPDVVAESAKMAEDAGADIVDFNCGCWVKKVVGHNAGAALLKDPDLMVEITEKAARSISIPFTVKTRLGWDADSINIIDIAPRLANAGAQALTIHCRTRSMGMTGAADWSWIPKIKEVVNVPVIINGDVTSCESAERAFIETGCDAVMIGRAAIGNPFIFAQIKKYMNTGILPDEPSPRERIETCIEHLHLSLDSKGNIRGLKEFRKHYSGYLKGMFNSSSVRQKLVVAENPVEIEAMLLEFADYISDLEESLIPVLEFA